MNKKKWTTVYLLPEALEALQNLDVKVMWKTLQTNSDKILYLVYKHNNKEI